MKKNHIIYLFLLVTSMNSCQREENSSEKVKGSLSINIGLFISVNEVENNLKSTLDVENFKVSIYKSGGEELLVFENASEIPEVIELEPGQYYITAHSDNNLPAAFNNPYYFGESEVFTISPGGEQTIAVNCELANTMVTIVYSDNIKNNYSDFITTVSSSAGSLTFAKEETRAGFFQPLPLNISVLLTWQKGDGTYESKTLTGSIPDPQPKRKYEIHINASAAEGSALLQINLDETTEPVEIVEITDNIETPVSGVFNSGDLLITEIMYDPTSLTDATGEWFEIYNNTNLPVDLQHLVIRRNDTEQHIINSQIILPSHAYLVLARTDGAAPGSKYVYNTSITLINTGAILSLYNYGTDGTNGSVICSINYGAEGFPVATGASLSLSPEFLNKTDAIKGESWCKSSTAFSTGDLGTPGLPNDECR
jgi:hypothetical protein